MWTRASLIERIAAGCALDLLLFWGHTPKHAGVTDASCLSQWFPAPFTLDGVAYATAEHYMMAEKARAFDDTAALARVLAATSPAEAKAAGRQVAGYDDAVWERVRAEAVVRGNVAKFGQRSELGFFLEATGERVLVEASPNDAIWGIGLAAAEADARDPTRWRGRNLLGFALMEARARLRERRAQSRPR